MQAQDHRTSLATEPRVGTAAVGVLGGLPCLADVNNTAGSMLAHGGGNGFSSMLLNTPPRKRHKNVCESAKAALLASADPKKFQQLTCPYCSTFFSDPSNLRRHIMTHTGERPFRCPLCDHSSSRKGNLLSHISGKHKQYFLDHYHQLKDGT